MTMGEKEVTTRGDFVLRLERGADVLPAIVDFCARRGITSGALRAIGAVESAKVGYYDLGAKKYEWVEYPEAMEAVSMTGNIAMVDSAPFIHAHVVLSDTKNNCIGGHLFSARVAVTLEIHLTAFNERINRTLDNDIGLKLLDV
ncbi:MAG: DNA-binding protein [bacterium]|nr:DNA-binding protein [bacterium]